MHIGWHVPFEGFANSGVKPPPVVESEMLMKEWKSTGSFWRPEKPEKIYWGSVTFIPGSAIRIILEGNLFEPDIPYGNEDCVLNGILFDGTPCTIFDAWCNVEYFVRKTRHFRTSVYSKLFLKGRHWKNLDDCKINKFQLRISHLDQWFNSPYKIKHSKNNFNKSILSFKPDKIDVECKIDEIEFKIKNFCARSVPLSATPEGASFPFKYYIIIETKNSEKLNWYLDISSKYVIYSLF